MPTLDEFLEVIKRFKWIKRINSQVEGRLIRIRLILSSGLVDIFHNQDTGKTSYAYVESGKRLFGANNTKIGWHIHPFENPDSHEKVEREVSIEEFLKALAQNLERQGKI